MKCNKNAGKGLFRKAFSTRFVTIRMKGGSKINCIVLDASLLHVTVLDIQRLRKTKIEMAGSPERLIKLYATRSLRIVDITSVCGDCDFFAV